MRGAFKDKNDDIIYDFNEFFCIIKGEINKAIFEGRNGLVSVGTRVHLFDQIAVGVVGIVVDTLISSGTLYKIPVLTSSLPIPPSKIIIFFPSESIFFMILSVFSYFKDNFFWQIATNFIPIGFLPLLLYQSRQRKYF